MTPDLDALLALANAATPGPWYQSDRRVMTDADGAKLDLVASLAATTAKHSPQGNAAFIAAARTAVPALIERVRELQGADEALAAAREAINARSENICVDIRRLIARAEQAEAGAAQLRETLVSVRAAVEENKGNWLEPYCDVNPEDCDHCTVVGVIDDALASTPTGSRVLERLKAAEFCLEALAVVEPRAIERLTHLRAVLGEEFIARLEAWRKSASEADREQV